MNIDFFNDYTGEKEALVSNITKEEAEKLIAHLRKENPDTVYKLIGCSCEICGEDMSEEDFNYSDICPECTEEEVSECYFCGVEIDEDEDFCSDTCRRDDINENCRD